MTRLLAFLGSLWGLGSALVLSGIRFANSSEPERDALTSVAFTVVYAAPFLLSLAALRWKNSAQQAAVWSAGGVLALFASFSAFSGISLIFLPAVPLLMLTAIFAVAQSFDSSGLRSGLPVLPVSLGLIGLGVAAFVALITLTSDPRCWVLRRNADGHEEWQVAPPDVASITVINEPNGQQGFGSGTMPPRSADGSSSSAPGIVTSTCTSDIISPIESAVSLALWIFAAVSLTMFRRYWSASPVPGEVAKG